MPGATHMAAMARAVAEGGAGAIRCESPADIRAIKQVVGLPLIGLWKQGETGVYITPTKEAAKAVADAGADMVAIDATERDRPVSVEELVRYIHDELELPVLADVSTLEPTAGPLRSRRDVAYDLCPACVAAFDAWLQSGRASTDAIDPRLVGA